MLLSSTHLLVLSGSCSFHAYPFNRSVVPFWLKFFSPYQALHLFSTGVLSEFVLPCSSFLTECFKVRSSLLYSFFEFAQPRKVLWFHSFVKEAT